MKPLPVVGILAALGALAACGSASGAPAGPRPTPAAAAVRHTPAAPTRPPLGSASGLRLWVHWAGPQGGGALSLVDAKTGSELRRLPAGVATPAWDSLYAATPAGRGTLVAALDPATGRERRHLVVAGSYSLPSFGLTGQPDGLSPGGRWLVLDGGVSEGSAPVTRLAVVSTSLAAPARQLSLSGRFEYDGISADGAHLYLLENLAAASGVPAYQVRSLAVATGQLDPRVIADKTDNGTPMTGVALSRLLSADGRWQLTAYMGGRRGPFVHALDLDNGNAFCLDLPPSTSGEEGDMTWTLAPGRSGSFLAVDAPSATAVELGGTPPQLLREVSLPVTAAALGGSLGRLAEAKRALSTGAVPAPDGHHLYVVGAKGVDVLDAATLARTGRLGGDLLVMGLALSRDGRHLALVDEEHGELAVIDTVSGSMSAPLAAVLPGRVDAVLRVEAAA